MASRRAESGLRVVEVALARTVPPAHPLLWLPEVRAHLNIYHSEHDHLLTDLAQAATDYLDAGHGVIGRALVTQTWRLSLSGAPTGGIVLPVPPVQSIAAVGYIDPDGVTRSLSVGGFILTQTENGACVDLASGTWPALSASRRMPLWVDFVAGYGTPEQVPQMFKHAAMLLVAHWYEAREAVGAADAREIPFSVSGFISALRTPQAFF